MELTSRQSRAARGLLNWSQDDLAKNADVSRATVNDLEAFNRTPMKNNLRSIADCFYAAGVELIPEEGEKGVGVRFRTQQIEYSRNMPIDRFHDRAVLRMRYKGEAFSCHVSLTAVNDYHRSNFSTDSEYSDAISRMMHVIIAAAERLAETRTKDGVLFIGYDDLR